MKKKSVALLLCATMLVPNCIRMNYDVKADEVSLDYIELTEDVQVEDIDDSILNDIDALVISDTLKSQDKNELNEIMDNGSGIIIENESVENVQDYFDVESITSYENEMGCYVCKDGDETKIIPIECNILADEDINEEITEDDYNNLLRNEEINYEQVISDYNNLVCTDKLDNVEEDVLATLQGTTGIGSAFMDNDKFVYFYKKGSAGGTGTTYKYSEKKAIDGWSIIGSISFSIYAIKIKTRGNITYDNIFSVAVATAYKDKHVNEFRNGISVTDSAKNKIIDYTEPKGNSNKSVSGTIGTGVNSNGDITSTFTTSYSYNPNGMDITTTLFSNRARWTCEPLSAKKNGSWKINPGILLKKTDGTKKSVTAKSYVSYFQLDGGVRTYTIKDTVSCGITFKNHKKS